MPFDFIWKAIVADVITSSIGIVCGIVRDSIADKLKDGDLAAERLRKIILRDLTDIKTKLDCLSLKDLKSSHSFLKEGVILILALDTSNEATTVVNDTASGVLSAALSLSEAVQTFKISYDKPFVSSRDCFKASRERATDAFNNEALSIKDRIMACKLRVAARILETGLEDPVAAVASCLLFLEELHGLPAASKYPNVFTWPGIKLTDRQFNPILNAYEISTPSDEKPAQQLHRVLHLPIPVYACAVNSRGEFIVLDDEKFKVINRSTGESKIATLPDTKGFHTMGAITVDSDDDVYILMSTLKSDVSSSWNMLCNRLLYVFDRNYDMKHKCILDIFDEVKPKVYAAIAVDKHKNIVMIGSGDVYVLDNMGKLKYKFAVDEDIIGSLSITNANDIITSHVGPVVRVYTVEGNLKRTIKVPDSEKFCRAKYHYGLGKIIVCHWEKEFTVLKCYSEEGKLEHTVYLRTRSMFLEIFGHTSGLFFVKVLDDTVIFI